MNYFLFMTPDSLSPDESKWKNEKLFATVFRSLFSDIEVTVRFSLRLNMCKAWKQNWKWNSNGVIFVKQCENCIMVEAFSRNSKNLQYIHRCCISSLLFIEYLEIKWKSYIELGSIENSNSSQFLYLYINYKIFEYEKKIQFYIVKSYTKTFIQRKNSNDPLNSRNNFDITIRAKSHTRPRIYCINLRQFFSMKLPLTEMQNLYS